MLLQIIYGGTGGHFSVSKALASRLKQRGIDSHIILVSHKPPESHLQLDLSMAGISYTYISTGSLFYQRVYFVVALYGVLKRLRPSLVLNHNRVAVLSTVLYRLLTSGARVVYRDNVPVAMKSWLDYCLLGLSHIVCNRVVYLTANSRKRSGFIATFFSNWDVIENPIDTDLFAGTSSLAKGDFRIGIACRLEPEKRVDDAIKAFGILTESGVTNARLVIAGDGQSKKELMHLTEELRLSSHVEFAGEIPYNNMPSFYNSLDIYMHTSVSENYSNSVLQAMSCRLPVVGADVPGIRELIGEGRGILVKGGSPIEFANRLRDLVYEPSRRIALGLKARAYVEAHNNPTTFLSYLMSLKE